MQILNMRADGSLDCIWDLRFNITISHPIFIVGASHVFIETELRFIPRAMVWALYAHSETKLCFIPRAVVGALHASSETKLCFIPRAVVRALRAPSETELRFIPQAVIRALHAHSETERCMLLVKQRSIIMSIFSSSHRTNMAFTAWRTALAKVQWLWDTYSKSGTVFIMMIVRSSHYTRFILLVGHGGADVASPGGAVWQFWQYAPDWYHWNQ